MLNLIIFCLSCSGLTWIVINGAIFDEIRPKHLIFRCSACFGFHSGWFVFLIFWGCGIQLFPSLAGMLIFGCIGSLVSYAFDKVLDDDGIKISLVTKKENEDNVER